MRYRSRVLITLSFGLLAACASAPPNKQLTLNGPAAPQAMTVGLQPSGAKGFYAVVEEVDDRWRLNRLGSERQTEIKEGEEQIFVGAKFDYVAPVLPAVPYEAFHDKEKGQYVLFDIKKDGVFDGYLCNRGYSEVFGTTPFTCKSKLLKLASLGAADGFAEYVAGASVTVLTLGFASLVLKDADPEVLAKILADTDFITKAHVYCGEHPDACR